MAGFPSIEESHLRTKTTAPRIDRLLSVVDTAWMHAVARAT